MLTFCAATSNFCEKVMLAGHSSPNDMCLQNASESLGMHALQVVSMPGQTLRAL